LAYFSKAHIHLAHYDYENPSPHRGSKLQSPEVISRPIKFIAQNT